MINIYTFFKFPCFLVFILNRTNLHIHTLLSHIHIIDKFTVARGILDIGTFNIAYCSVIMNAVVFKTPRYKKPKFVNLYYDIQP